MVLHAYLIFSAYFGYRCIKHFCMRIYAAYKHKQVRQSEAGQFIDLVSFLNLVSLFSYWVLDSPTL